MAGGYNVRKANLDGIARRRRGGVCRQVGPRRRARSTAHCFALEVQTDLFCPSTGLPACLRAPSSAFPPAAGLNCCLPWGAAPLRPASPFAVAVDMAAGMAEESERGGGGGVRSEVEGVERPSWRTGGDRRSQVDGCEALLRGPSGGESTRRRAPDETRARLERGRGDECESRGGERERGVASPLTGWWRW